MQAVPCKMLQNFKSSFALLVDARLRAFGTILARHAQHYNRNEDEEDEGVLSLRGATDRKLSALLQVGAHLTMDSAVTSFTLPTAPQSAQHYHPTPTTTTTTSAKEDEGDCPQVSLPLTFEAIVDVGIPNLTNSSSSTSNSSTITENDALTVIVQCPATLSGHFPPNKSSSTLYHSDDHKLQSVDVTFDTHALLASMISQASMVVMKIVENVNSACSFEPTPIIQQQPQQQSQPMAQQQQQPNQQDNQSTINATSPSIVSPDFGAMATCLHDNLRFAPLDLHKTTTITTATTTDQSEEDDDDDDDKEILIADENCAAFIDDVISGVDEELLCRHHEENHHPRPSTPSSTPHRKRVKIQSPSSYQTIEIS
eukprot:5438729-Ditylum_brightwellii.AAC.1